MNLFKYTNNNTCYYSKDYYFKENLKTISLSNFNKNKISNNCLISLSINNINQITTLKNYPNIKGFIIKTNVIDNDKLKFLQTYNPQFFLAIETSNEELIPILNQNKIKVIYNITKLVDFNIINKLKLHGIKITIKKEELSSLVTFLENINENIVIYKLPNVKKINKLLLSTNSYQGFNKSILNEVKRQIINHVNSNDLVIDATIGNGYDTLFLASLVKSGQVIGFDIQRSAIENTKNLTKEYNNVTLYCQSHENINKINLIKKPSLILFNLGYLPGGNKNITTKANHTLNAIQNGLEILDNKGIILIVVYPGHPEGKKEEQVILTWLQSSKINYTIKRNTTNPVAPFLIIIKH